MFSQLLLLGALAIPVPDNAGVCLSPEEAELVRITNEYRVANGKPALPVSKWLATTAQYHGWDMVTNNAIGGSCGIHSWSNNPPLFGPFWEGVCYTFNSPGTQMWNKPRQISNNVYTGNGFEVAAVSGGQMDAITALSSWQFSASHREVILQQGVWAGVSFQGLGVGIVGNYGTMWFGDGANAGGTMAACPNEAVFSNGFE